MVCRFVVVLLVLFIINLNLNFSNSLIIYQVKTKKIIIVKEVWIPGLNKQRYLRFYFSVYAVVIVSIEKIYQTLETVFHQLPIANTSNVVKNIPLRVVFSTLFSVFGYADETLSLVFYTLHQHLALSNCLILHLKGPNNSSLRFSKKHIQR